MATGAPIVLNQGSRAKLRQYVAPAMVRPGTQHHRGDAFKRGVVRRFAVFAGPTRLLVTADEEDPVVRAGGDRQHRQDVRGERGEPERVVVGEHRDDSPCTSQRDKRHEQLDQRGDDRAVDQQQHDRDRAQGEQRDFGQAGVADDVHVVGQRRGTGDIGLHPGRGGFVVDDLADGLDRVVGLGGALVAGDVDLHVGALGVGALRACRGEPVTPEVLDVLDVRGVLAQFAHDVVVVAVRGVAEWLLALPRTTITVLLESNSWKLCPIRIIAFIDGASRGAIGAECASPTTSSFGTATLTITVTTTQPRMIGIAKMRMKCGMNGRWGLVSAGCSRGLLGPLLSVCRRCPGSVAHADFTRQNVWALWPSEL